MTNRALLLALAGAFTAFGDTLTQLAEGASDGEAPAAPAKARAVQAKAPPPKAAAAPAKAGPKRKAAPAPEVDFETLKGKLVQVMKDVSKEAAVAILDRYGCQKLSDLKEDMYDDCNTYLDQVIAGEVDPLAADTDATDDDALFG